MSHELDDTLICADAATIVGTAPPEVRVSVRPPAAQSFEERYQARGLLGEGGMGEVRCVHDERIGRDVALKRILAGRDNDALSRRFVREARVQGQLEHPAVVPVYDMGVAEGSLYFTMKRVRGTTLAKIIEDLEAGHPEARAQWPRGRLLSAFTTLCLAVDYAHSRGVIHRDLKPANVMLGAWGEVHLLDWGIARVRGATELLAEGAAAASASDQTLLGALMGTPGYLAPEQARGEHDTLDGRADVYSLGAILFEILALRAMHEGNSTGRIAATVAPKPDAGSPRKVDPSIPPELDAICVRATEYDPGRRFLSARALADEIERFMDGDRDVETRRALASEAVRDAERLTAEQPAEALRKLGAALALDPENGDALVALERALSALPEETPPEARGELDAQRHVARRHRSRGSATRALIWLAASPWLIAFGVQSWPLAGALTASIAMAFAMAVLAYFRPERRGTALASDAMTLVAVGMMSLIAGPLILVPTIAATSALLHGMHEAARSRHAIMALAVAVIALPFLASEAGLLPAFYTSTPEGGLLVMSPMLRLPAAHTTLFLLVASVASVLTPTVMAGRLRDQLAAAERRIFLQAWHLRHLLPSSGASRRP